MTDSEEIENSPEDLRLDEDEMRELINFVSIIDLIDQADKPNRDQDIYAKYDSLRQYVQNREMRGKPSQALLLVGTGAFLAKLHIPELIIRAMGDISDSRLFSADDLNFLDNEIKQIRGLKTGQTPDTTYVPRLLGMIHNMDRSLESASGASSASKGSLLGLLGAGWGGVNNSNFREHMIMMLRKHLVSLD